MVEAVLYGLKNGLMLPPQFSCTLLVYPCDILAHKMGKLYICRVAPVARICRGNKWIIFHEMMGL
jgi:hypothetical protein